MKNIVLYLHKNQYKILIAIGGSGYCILIPLLTERTNQDFLLGLGWFYMFANIPFGSAVNIIIDFIPHTIEAIELYMGWNMKCGLPVLDGTMPLDGSTFCLAHSFGTEWQLPVMGVTGFINLFIVFFLILFYIERISLYIYKLMMK